MILCNKIRVKWFKLRLIGNAVLQLTKATHDSGAVRLFIALMVKAHAELDREPVDGGEAFELYLAGSEGREADFLTEVGEVLVGEHRGVADELVDDVGLGSVLRGRVVPYVLC